MTINISYPRESSLSARCLARFLQGQSLKHREADRVSGSYRLAGFVHYLECKHGWEFLRQEKKEDTLDPIGRRATYIIYWLPNRLIKWAGEAGQSFAERVLRCETDRVAARMAATTQTAETECEDQTYLDSQITTPDAYCQGRNNGSK